MITKKYEIVRANIIVVEVGTTGYCGGDAGHGGRTMVSIEDLGGTAFEALIRQGGKEYLFDMSGGKIEIRFAGDSELETLIEALECATRELKLQVETMQKQYTLAEAVMLSHKGKIALSISQGVVLTANRKRLVFCTHRAGDDYRDRDKYKALSSRHVKPTPEMILACDWVVIGERPNVKKEQNNVPMPINNYPVLTDERTLYAEK